MSTLDDNGRKGDKLIDQLPRNSWHERSYAYWADKQLHASDRWWRPLSTAVLGTATTAMSVFLKLGFRRVVTEDLHKLTDVLEDSERNRPVITVANHQSTVDDPVIWGAMPARMRWNPDCTRWTLGARELLYMNPFVNGFFALGQTIPTVRGDGIYQLAVEIGLKKLGENKWVHVFPEARVNQESELLRFKWGVSRMIMESERTPIVIPMYLSGMSKVLPLRQRVPVPRPNPFKSLLYIKVGDCIDFTLQLEQWKAARAKLPSADKVAQLDEQMRVSIAEKLRDSVNQLKSDVDDKVVKLESELDARET
ncbi:Lyso-phosphatidylcholine acyltransferase [Coemansia sp. RSA 1813]|nr:Lyso-phosphatidylcholine acyltransferase [Coemansia sp. RSA 1646]KAJ1772428.1 Lyso-phosphatidylcholine acyltransferase [Coemansia sp. RSA 1843]KAJ2213598.1 Lyso-phosphatidylcholine acyltransferase [Coemansia sp. RSA 487]KAJ2571129.1 Lyso-phosphatidylcholine acyltransferase [Coemansia sp. RSA 1813]